MDLQVLEGWILVSDMDYGVLMMDDIMFSVLVVGDYQVFIMELDGVVICIGICGEGWLMSEQVFVDEVVCVVVVSYVYWNMFVELYFVLIMLVDVLENWQSLGGINLGDSFVFFVMCNLDLFMFIEILMYEYMYIWMFLCLGGLIDGDEQLFEYWFFEGFMEFLI